MPARSRRSKAPMAGFSRTERCGKTRRPSGQWAMPGGLVGDQAGDADRPVVAQRQVEGGAVGHRHQRIRQAWVVHAEWGFECLPKCHPRQDASGALRRQFRHGGLRRWARGGCHAAARHHRRPRRGRGDRAAFREAGRRRLWAPQTAALAARFRTLAFDHRGTGRNAGALPEPHSGLHMAEDAGEVMQAAMPSPSSSRSRSTACRWNSSAADIGTANRSAGPVATAGGRHSEPGFRA